MWTEAIHQWKDFEIKGIYYSKEVKFVSDDYESSDGLFMQANGHVDQATELFYIGEPDANFVHVKWKQETVDPKLMV